MYILIWLLTLSTNAFPLSLESTYLRALSSARDSTSVEHLLRAYEQLKIARTACKIQLTATAVPVACYQTLALENNLKLHKSPRDQQALVLHLDSLCQQATLSLTIQPTAPTYVSNRCRQWLQRAGEIARYRQTSARSVE
jgi:hypothetical protein